MTTTDTRDGLGAPATREDVLDALRGVRDEVKAMIAAAKTELSLALAKALDARIDGRVAVAFKDFKEQSRAVQGTFDKAMNRLEAVIKAMPRPEVTVNVPEAGVTVNVPQRKVTKHITYDQDGRPSSIREEEG